MNAFAKTKSSFGFSLIELMFGIAIMVILTTVAVPSFQTWLRNSQIRTATESITNGLQRARAEAVARNADVEFILGTGANSASSWTVNFAIGPVDPPIDTRSSSEGSKDVTRTVLPAGTTTVTFNNFGGVWTNPGPICPGLKNRDCTDSLSQVDLVAAGSSQNLRVTIGVGGNARMCDPNLAPGSSPRAC